MEEVYKLYIDINGLYYVNESDIEFVLIQLQIVDIMLIK